MGKRAWTAHRIHRWAGLAAGLWLAVLGGTGFVLDHRDWAWLWQTGVSPRHLPETLVEAARGHVRLYRIVDDERRLAGGPSGLWYSTDGGQRWQAVSTPAGRLPPVHQLARLESGWLLATADGLWRLDEDLAHARPWRLRGQAVTALAPRAPRQWWGVADRSRIFHLDLDSGTLRWHPLAPLDPAQLPPDIDLSRLVHDLHFGRGLLPAPGSLWWSDAAAVALVLLPLGGVLYWWLPRHFRRRRAAGRPLPQGLRRGVLRGLYRLHAPTLGLLTALPIVYLSLTGILLDHRAELRPLLKETRLPQALLPPVYALSHWRGEIHAVVGWPDQPQRVSLGTRLGLFTSDDGGQTFRREPLAGGRAVFVWSARQGPGWIALGGMGAPNHLWQDGAWAPLPHGAHAPTDVTRDADGRLWWTTRAGLKVWDGAGYRPHPGPLPDPGFVPWYFVIEGLHDGRLIHPQWVWVNDAMAVLALILAGTGLWRWWRVKWR